MVILGIAAVFCNIFERFSKTAKPLYFLTFKGTNLIGGE